MSVHPAGERPSVVISLSFRVFRVFRGFNCCFQVLAACSQFGLIRVLRAIRGLWPSKVRRRLRTTSTLAKGGAMPARFLGLQGVEQ